MTSQVGPLSAHEAAFAANVLGVHLGEVQAQHDAVPVLGLVIGMAPGPHTSKHLPMFPWPEGSAGGRLLAMSGMPAAAYLGRLRRANVCDGPFRIREARDRARNLVERALFTDGVGSPRFVLCGRRVEEAFDFTEDRPRSWFARWEAGGAAFVLIPHLSGRSREYNDPAAVARARDAVRWAARWEGE